jgi:hypothetical protein
LPGVPEDRSVTVHNNTPRTPGLNTLGFFIAQRNMTETDSKKRREIEFTRQHTLSPEQFKKLIEEKMIRARVHSKSVRKRETVLQKDYR